MRQALVLGVALLVLGVGTAAGSDKAKKVNGRVSAVTADSITIAQGMGALTIGCDSTTQVKAAKGQVNTARAGDAAEKSSLQDSIAVGDNVAVTYSEADGTLRASAVKVTHKASVNR